MLKQGQDQKIGQQQSLQQKLSPQQIQYIKLLQLPTIGLEQRVKEEIEMNPVLEEAEPEELIENVEEIEREWEESREEDSDEPDPVDKNEEIDWDSFLHNTEYDGQSYSGASAGNEEWRDMPNPYHESLLEELENQVSLLDLDETEKLIADQILGSLDSDGYFRRDLEAVVDNISFNHGVLTTEKTVDKVRKKIQRIEPVGIASRDLRDCLIIQLEMMDREDETAKIALKILKNEWHAFERKHFSKLKSRLGIDDKQLKSAFELIRGLDPRPGAIASHEEETSQYIEPDFEVYFAPESEDDQESGEFVIKLNQRNIPPLKISPHYKEIWDDLKKKKKGSSDESEARSFIKNKVESAQWFIESIRQRQKTLLDTMKTIVALQEDFFKFGDGLKPMILKDVADRINLDISTISRVVNGKYVQTNFGVFELKYFFSEGLAN
jgi:RNA polymerase sigma-54 factor